MRILLSFLLVSLLGAGHLPGQSGFWTEAALLYTLEGAPSSLKKLSNKKPLVIIYLNTECPISQKYLKTLNELLTTYEEKVAFAGVFTRWDTPGAIRKFAKEYELRLPLTLDPQHKLLQLIDAQITPEVFLFDSSGKERYRGAIDNWFYALGRNRARPTAHYLRDALDAVLQGKVVPTAKTKSIGCAIEK